MTRTDLFWSAGDRIAQGEIERAVDGGLEAMICLHQSRRRSVYLVPVGDVAEDSKNASPLVLKVHHTATGRHPLRESLKRLFKRSAAGREWRALEALHEQGVPVPRPRAWGRLGSGDEIIVSDYLEGEHLDDFFREASPESRSQIVTALARAIQSLRAADYIHGDLHLGNLWIQANKVYLLDLERARPGRNPHQRLADQARLEFSLAKAGWNAGLRASLRHQLGENGLFDSVLRLFLRDYLRGRARRVLRIGRNWSVASVGQYKGLRESSLDADTLEALFAAAEHDAEPRTRRNGRIQITEASANGHPVIVKRVSTGGLLRALADVLRGSSAARAFHAGQRLGLLTNRAARPLAYLEERRFGLPLKSWLVVEKVGDEDLDGLDPKDPALESRLATALGDWLAEGHAWGLSHRDLKGGNVRVTVEPESIRFWLIDLEDLNGPDELRDDARLLALSQLNASLPDDALSLENRRAALDRYLARAPFAETNPMRIAAEISRRSLARRHHWQGKGCALAYDQGQGISSSRSSPSEP